MLGELSKRHQDGCEQRHRAVQLGGIQMVCLASEPQPCGLVGRIHRLQQINSAQYN